MAQEFQPGEKVGAGRYVLERELGRGGMGVVWLANDTELGEQVALKFVPSEIQHDAMALDDMRRETLKSRRLTHPHIARIHDFCNFEGEAPFITMEFMDGPNLSALQVQQPDRVFKWEEIQPWIKQLCSALQYAHEENVIHRDLKPGNLMIDSKGRIKLCDFGLAASAADSLSRVSRDMGSSGTPPYMSPQQLDGGAPSPSDDIYSLGATLYELLTGKPPFHSGDIPHQIRSNAPKSIPDKLAELGVSNPVPEAAVSLVMQCLVKNPVHRPANAEAVAEAASGIATGPPPLPADSVVEVVPDAAVSEACVEEEAEEDVIIPEATELSEPEPSEPPEELQRRARRKKIAIWAFIGFVLLSALKKGKDREADRNPPGSAPASQTGGASDDPSEEALSFSSATPVSLIPAEGLKGCKVYNLRQRNGELVSFEGPLDWTEEEPWGWSINAEGVIEGKIEAAAGEAAKSYLVFDEEAVQDFELGFNHEFHNDIALMRMAPRRLAGVFYRSRPVGEWHFHGLSPLLNSGDIFTHPPNGTRPGSDGFAGRFWNEVDPDIAGRLAPPAPLASSGDSCVIKVRGGRIRHFQNGEAVLSHAIVAEELEPGGRIAIEIWAEGPGWNVVEFEGFFLKTYQP